MTTPEIKTSEAAPAEVGILQSVEQAIFLTAAWADRNQKEIAQMLLVPDGEEITIQLERDAEPEQLVLTGDALKGFKAGLIVASNIFGDLPFAKASDEQVAAYQAAQAPAEQAPSAAANDAPASGN